MARDEKRGFTSYGNAAVGLLWMPSGCIEFFHMAAHAEAVGVSPPARPPASWDGPKKGAPGGGGGVAPCEEP